MTNEENYLRTIEFREPEWIQCTVSLMPATWARYREELEDIVIRHPIIFGLYKKGSRDFSNFSTSYTEGTYTDAWGCRWANIRSGLDGQELLARRVALP